MKTTTLQLAKQNFKFSAAHFLIFDAHRAERLHGHNYQVRLEILETQKNPENNGGYLIDFHELKKVMKKHLDQWDEMVLLPKLHPEMKSEIKGATIEIRFRERFYAFPKEEVLLLPLINTSVEQFSSLLAESLCEEFKTLGAQAWSVSVEESPGQGATTKISLD